MIEKIERVDADFVKKINDLIDTVNELQKNATISKMEKVETEDKDLSDKIGKLETELEKTRKALDVAWDGLKKIGSGDIIEHSVVGHENDNKIFIANKALDESKTALEQKGLSDV